MNMKYKVVKTARRNTYGIRTVSSNRFITARNTEAEANEIADLLNSGELKATNAKTFK